MIQVEGLTKRYGDRTAVNKLTFNAQQGEIVGFLGPNGAGKTTTMRILTGFMPPSEGVAPGRRVAAARGLMACTRASPASMSTPAWA